MDATTRGRDRLRELLDAVLDEGEGALGDMAGRAYASPFHFSRQLTQGAGEPPVALRRRVMLERAAWQLRGGAPVTEVAHAAGYASVEGFARAYARAFGHPPSQTPAGPPAGLAHWLPAPNGIHFHPPTSLWVTDERGQAQAEPGVTALLVHHDLEDTRALLVAAAALDTVAFGAVLLPGHQVLAWDGPEESLAHVLAHLVRTKEVWVASIEGADWPPEGPADAGSLLSRHDDVAGRWLAVVRDVERRGAWGDRVVDALCDPPESFVLSSVLAHVLEYSAHRRQLARTLLRAHGAPTDHGDPIDWLRRRHEEDP